MTELVIERIGEKGDGLAQGRAIPRSLPGEHVRLEQGGAITILQPSPERVEAFCPAFESCGGCKLQHWRLEPYAAWKRGLLVQALKARGLEPAVAPLLDAHGAGRRRASLHVRQINGAWQAGYMAAGSHALVPLQACPILVPRLREAPLLAARFGALFGPCDVAVTAADNGLDFAIKAARKLADKALAGVEPLMQEHAITRIAVNGETLMQRMPPMITLGPANVALPVGAFLQATAAGEETLAGLVLGHLGKARQVADLFAGLGPFALRIAQSRAVTAFDSDKPAIAALQQALRHVQGLRPLKAEVRDLFRSPLTPMELNEFDAVVLDPPRAGAEAQCHALAKSKVRRVVSVSCDVQSFARDAAILTAAGYVLGEVTPVDQFKYSAHVECVGLFTRR
ncbi:MAG: class I SAM-dependent RNA methyltransferase [Alphaproteobacteria bacterium]|nr:class I SAM-dependent RNA methyltransferase [Alphaproteobacteria bacterium]